MKQRYIYIEVLKMVNDQHAIILRAARTTYAMLVNTPMASNHEVLRTPSHILCKMSIGVKIKKATDLCSQQLFIFRFQ